MNHRGRGCDGLHQHRKGDALCFTYVGDAGLRHHRSTATTNHGQARTARAEFLRQLRDGALPTGQADLTLRQALEAHLDSIEATGRPVRWLRQMVRPVLAALGGKRLLELMPGHLERYRVERLKAISPSRQRRISPDTVNRELRPVLRLLKDANLGDRFRSFRRLKVERSIKGKVISEQQEDALLQLAIQRPQWAAAIYVVCLACNTGLRSGEIKHIRLEQLDLVRNQIFIPRDATKTDSGERWVPLNGRALWIVGRLLELAAGRGSTRPQHYLLAADAGKQKYGKGWDSARPQKSIMGSWRQVRKAAGLDGYRPHDGRHTAITRSALAGTPIAVAMAMYGHLSPETTRYYTHINSPEMREAAAAIDRPLPTFLEGTYATV